MSLYQQVRNGQYGDALETITTTTGIKAIVEAIAPNGCGCEERKEKMNNWGK